VPGEFVPFAWVLVAAINYLIAGLPFAFIARRAGFSPWWSLLFFTGPFALIGLWVLALKRWPAIEHLKAQR
jgi:hypothetical protein